MDNNYHKIAFETTIDWHFRDGIPQEWYNLSTKEEFEAVLSYRNLLRLLNNVELIADEVYENEAHEWLADRAWNLYNTLCMALSKQHKKPFTVTMAGTYFVEAETYSDAVDIVYEAMLGNDPQKILGCGEVHPPQEVFYGHHSTVTHEGEDMSPHEQYQLRWERWETDEV